MFIISPMASISIGLNSSFSIRLFTPLFGLIAHVVYLHSHIFLMCSDFSGKPVITADVEVDRRILRAAEVDHISDIEVVYVIEREPRLSEDRDDLKAGIAELIKDLL